MWGYVFYNKQQGFKKGGKSMELMRRLTRYRNSMLLFAVETFTFMLVILGASVSNENRKNDTKFEEPVQFLDFKDGSITDTDQLRTKIVTGQERRVKANVQASRQIKKGVKDEQRFKNPIPIAAIIWERSMNLPGEKVQEDLETPTQSSTLKSMTSSLVTRSITEKAKSFFTGCFTRQDSHQGNELTKTRASQGQRQEQGQEHGQEKGQEQRQEQKQSSLEQKQRSRTLEEIPSVTFQRTASRRLSFKSDESWQRGGITVDLLPSQRLISIVLSPTCQPRSHTEPEEFSIAENIKNINMLPGTGEFIYDTKIQEKQEQRVQMKRNQNQYVPVGSAKSINHNSYSGKTDAVVSLENLKNELPNVEWVSVVVSWFASSLDIKNCKIFPAVEFQNEFTATEEWQVGDIKREKAKKISKIKGRHLRYGGTVSDAVLVRYIDELRRRGYKVMLYPILLLDTKDREWRGRITGLPRYVSNFFSSQYNTFIKHYSVIAKQTNAEGFVIGSELTGLTKIKDLQGNYPVVSELVQIAKHVKMLLGKEVVVTYAALYFEYHLFGGWYFLDELWSSEYIDVVGINAYFPLTDGPEPPTGYTVQDVINGWDSGEGYNYYWDYAKNPPRKMRYADTKWQWKKIDQWWSEVHINPDGKQTKWQPKMKKIWFTEFGYESVDGCANEPYAVTDINRPPCRYPRYSNKKVSFQSQKVAIEATLRKWRNSEMVEKMFLFAWDARPFPHFPNLRDVWGDCGNWEAGYWIQGKIGKSLEPKRESVGGNTGNNFEPKQKSPVGNVGRNLGPGRESHAIKRDGSLPKSAVKSQSPKPGKRMVFAPNGNAPPLVFVIPEKKILELNVA